MNIELHVKSQDNQKTVFTDTANLSFLSTLGMPRHSWLDPTEIARLICSFYECLTAYKNFKTIAHLFLKLLAIKGYLCY